MSHETAIVPKKHESAPLLELEELAHATPETMEITCTVREKLRESLGDVTWCVLSDGLARLIFNGRRVHSWELRHLQVSRRLALDTAKGWRRCLVTFHLGAGVHTRVLATILLGVDQSSAPLEAAPLHAVT